MNQPDTTNVPDYNRDRPARGRRKFKFNPFRPPTDINGYYSAFWPLLIVFLSFIVLLLYEISVLRFRESVLVQQTNRYTEIMQKEKWQADFIQGLHGDLKALAPTHPAAVALLKEFFPEAPAQDQSTPSP